MRLMHLDLDVHVVGAVTTPAIGAGDLLIIGSGSGRTPSIIGQAQRACELNARVALITIAGESPVSKYADHILKIQASSPKLADEEAGSVSVQPMGSLYEQSLGILCDVMIGLLMEELGTDPRPHVRAPHQSGVGAGRAQPGTLSGARSWWRIMKAVRASLPGASSGSRRPQAAATRRCSFSGR